MLLSKLLCTNLILKGILNIYIIHDARKRFADGAVQVVTKKRADTVVLRGIVRQIEQLLIGNIYIYIYCINAGV